MSGFVFNKEATDALQAQEKFIEYNEWLRENGCIYDKLICPAAFTTKDDPTGKNALIGVYCKEDILPNEVAMYVPNKLVISTETARNSDIAEIYRTHSDIFVSNADRDYLTLVLFVIWERTKGEEGFWHAYFECAQDADLPAVWEDHEV